MNGVMVSFHLNEQERMVLGVFLWEQNAERPELTSCGFEVRGQREGTTEGCVSPFSMCSFVLSSYPKQMAINVDNSLKRSL